MRRMAQKLQTQLGEKEKLREEKVKEQEKLRKTKRKLDDAVSNLKADLAVRTSANAVSHANSAASKGGCMRTQQMAQRV